MRTEVEGRVYVIWRIPISGGGGVLELEGPVCALKWRGMYFLFGGYHFQEEGVYFSWRGRYANWSRIVVNHVSSGGACAQEQDSRQVYCRTDRFMRTIISRNKANFNRSRG